MKLIEVTERSSGEAVILNPAAVLCFKKNANGVSVQLPLLNTASITKTANMQFPFVEIQLKEAWNDLQAKLLKAGAL